MNRLSCLIWSTIAIALTVGTVATARPMVALDDRIEKQVIAELERVAAEEDQVRYRGQFAALIPLGPRIGCRSAQTSRIVRVPSKSSRINAAEAFSLWMRPVSV